MTLVAITASELETKLWGAADILRGQIDSADYKNYILAMLFLKRLSDHFNEELERAVSAGLSPAEAEGDPDEHEFFLPADCRWKAIREKSSGLGEVLNKAGSEIEAANAPRLSGILTATNWNDDSKLGNGPNRDGIIDRLLKHFDGLNLRDDNLAGGNVLGDAYEYLIKQFADDSGRKGGEFYTPRSVVRLLVELLQPREGMRICDPTAGSGGMLIWSAEYVKEHGGNQVNLVLHGQEKNLGTLGIGKLNLLLHGLHSVRMEAGDTIRDPRLLDDRGRLLSYDRVIANPPFSLKDWGHEKAAADPQHRFDGYGAIPPPTRGDYAFMEHMIATTNAEGMVGVVMPHGVLFRGGAEATIRKSIIEKDLFEAIIGLAPNLFYGAGIPVAICIVNKAKQPERRGKLLFVDAAQPGYFRAGKAQNFLDQEHITGIVEAFTAFAEVSRFAHVADLNEIEQNDFNLNISRYVDTAVESEQIDIGAALARLRQLERERDEAVAKMDRLLAELGYV
ncbi:MAG: N-6 DNA methylase [Dehalococcoidia bacterium]